MRRTPSTPPQIPGLRFERLLGSGGFADVFLYEQQLPKRQVAVKVLLAEHLSDQTREAFVAEANLMAQLSAHPYIVTIYTADVAPDGRPYLAMEYCAGPSLAEQYKTRRFSAADALRTGIRLASAVATAHAAGILHRDIKPANVLTNAYGWPALTDFGISSTVELDLPTQTIGAIADADGASGTSGSQSVGMSIPWSPAEMFDDAPKPDVRSDVFSLAATVYTLLAGRTPFEVPGQPNGAADLISRIERGAVTPLGRDDLPRSLVATLWRGLSRERADRFETAVDFARALQRVELELSFAPTPIDVPNLVQTPHQPSRAQGSGAGADETKVRSVQTIDAQPVGRADPSADAAGAAVAASVQQASAAAAATVVRGAIPVVSPAAPDETVRRRTPREETPSEDRDQDGTSSTPPSAARARRPIGSTTKWSLIAAAVVVVAGGVTAGIVLPSLAPGTASTASPGASTTHAAASGAPIQLDSVPAPEQVSVDPSADGTSVTFTWKNPEPVDGDRFVWQRTDGRKDARKTPTTEPTATVTDVVPGQNVCIEVFTVRGGVTSAAGLETCLHG
ncbi:protein kinase domain-containing protein [Plantibacter sp. Mn2098]|uniref:protein kinase domain-containing protein n=1 Tax=Plantibacter sp. Mn2098 TaxID=3395266 RepID=UPI003BCA21FB